MFSSINQSALCGEESLIPWDKKINDFGQCFQTLALVLPSHALLAIVSAYYAGLRSDPYFIRSPCAKYTLYLRCAITFFLAITPAIFFIPLHVLFDIDIMKDKGWSQILETSVKTLAWTLHLLYNLRLIERVNKSPRGPFLVMLIWISCLLSNVIQSRSTILTYRKDESEENSLLFYNAIIQTGCLIAYALTLLIGWDSLGPDSGYEEIESGQLRSGLSYREYGSFHEEVDPNYLGVAKERVPFLGKLLFYWVYPLISKGRRRQISSPDDVFDLPPSVNTGIVSDTFEHSKSSSSSVNVNNEISGTTPTKWLMKLLVKNFGKEFLKIGVLKFFGDVAGFCSPLLLNLLITFMQSEGEDLRMGYAYSIALFITTLSVSLCNVHFNFSMNELGLKIRASVIQSIYKHVLSVSTTDLSQFSKGEVLNFMSVDTDRIVNFAPSLQAFWSLPFQASVTLYLLYLQLGYSCFVGLGVAVLMIPINKVIASKIGTLSSSMMDAKDIRIKTISEILKGNRVIKYFCWEDFFTQRVNVFREKELHYLKNRKYLDAVCVYLWATTPVIISVLTFSVYSLTGHTLTAPNVFTSMALFNMLTGPLNSFPWVINGLIESSVSIRRIARFLSVSTLNRDSYFDVEHDDHYDLVAASAEMEVPTIPDVNIQSGCFTVGVDSDSFALRGLDLKIEKGNFVGVVGPVGCGKTSFLNSILGETRKESGTIYVTDPLNGIAYVQQQPWIQRGTVRDNILFGQNYNHRWYMKVISACGLTRDFRGFRNGDLANVGESGSTLSGGQKTRISLARAVYQDKELYLIDDIFSSLDPKIAKWIYKKCIRGLLKSKTLIVCTHHPKFIMDADITIHLQEGHFEHVGTTTSTQTLEFKLDEDDDDDISNSNDEEGNNDDDCIQKLPIEVEDDPLIEDENREVGAVKFTIYKHYWIAVGKILTPMILCSLFFMQLTSNVTDLWLSHWVSTEKTLNGTSPFQFYYIEVYGAIAMSNTVFTLMRAFLFAYGGVRAAKVIHDSLLGVIIRAKVVFFDTTPFGRILNRFSSDIFTVDDSLPFILNIFLAQFFGVIGSIFVCIYAVPWLILPLIPLSFFYYDIQSKYRPASQDLKRIGSVSLSPIYEHFSETIAGLTTIRAFKATQRFLLENEVRLELNQKAQYSSYAAAQWLELRLQLIGCVMVFGISAIAVINYQSINAGLVGLAISYALGITGRLSSLISSFTETEKELVASERCYEYIDRLREERYEGILSLPFNWPSEGIVEFKDVKLRYREHLPYVLKGVSFVTKAREKVGIVGRTGAGKSSLFAALFRTTSFCHGEILIDGVKIRLMALKDLRRNISIIPQEPFLFHGTVRQNLDPLHQYTDEQLWDSLKKSHLYKKVKRFGQFGLHTVIGDGRRSFSAGQKQLLCLARAILSPARIVCVDEATANVDLYTDRLIQDVLKTALCDRTVITIAHRVDTVLGCDRVIVMNNGKVIENGHPNLLLQDPDSEFSKLVQHY